ncbi:MAG: ABC transporter permease [Oscillospiraceae bacterium]
MSNNKREKKTSTNKNRIEKPESQLRIMWDALKKNKAALIGLAIIILLIFIAIFGDLLAPYSATETNMADAKQGMSSAHWFGTDVQGRDIFSRILSGTKYSLLIGIAAVAFSMIIGTFIGAIAGYFGGKLDAVLMRIMDMMLAIPSILLAITLMAAFGQGLDKAIIAIGTVSIPEFARIVRGSILSAKENDYVAAAKVLGNSNKRIIFKHILPNIMSSIVVRATLGISTAILDIAALGFLGLGVKPPTPEWGTMLGDAKSYIMSLPHMIIFPGIAISIAVLAFNLFGDGLRDALDPKSRN